MERIAEAERLGLTGGYFWFGGWPKLNVPLFDEHVPRLDLADDFFGCVSQACLGDRQQADSKQPF